MPSLGAGWTDVRVRIHLQHETGRCFAGQPSTTLGDECFEAGSQVMSAAMMASRTNRRVLCRGSVVFARLFMVSVYQAPTICLSNNNYMQVPKVSLIIGIYPGLSFLRAYTSPQSLKVPIPLVVRTQIRENVCSRQISFPRWCLSSLWDVDSYCSCRAWPTTDRRRNLQPSGNFCATERLQYSQDIVWAHCPAR